MPSDLRAVTHSAWTDTDCLVVAADYNRADAVREIVRDVQTTESCALHVVGKGPRGCEPYESLFSKTNVTCEAQPNVGDEAATATRFVWEHYEHLPNRLLFVPASTKWGRLPAFRGMLHERHNLPHGTFRCIAMNAGQLGRQLNWKLDHYSGGEGKANLTLASPRPLGHWLARHAGLYPTAPEMQVPVCAHLVWSSTATLLRERSRSLYKALTVQLEAATHPEAAHYVERAAGAIFAGKRRWWNLFCGGQPLCENVTSTSSPRAADTSADRGLLWWRANVSLGIGRDQCAKTARLECWRPDNTSYSCWC